MNVGYVGYATGRHLLKGSSPWILFFSTARTIPEPSVQNLNYSYSLGKYTILVYTTLRSSTCTMKANLKHLKTYFQALLGPWLNSFHVSRYHT